MKKFINPTLYKAPQFSNRWLYEVLPDGSWKDRPCFIIGGGPSLKGFDWSKLKGKRTIAINRAFERFEPTIIFSMDTRFLKWLETNSYGAEVTRKFLTTRAYKVWLCTYVCRLPSSFFIVKVYKSYTQSLTSFNFSMKEGLGHGDNSGYGALNLACCLGANPIYLLGFDMKHKEGDSHWHDGHPDKQAAATAEGWVKWFTKVAPRIAHRGFKVINLNPDSGLECFEKKRPEEVL